MTAGDAASFALFVSGLEFGGAHWNPLATTLLMEYITGNLGTASVSLSAVCCAVHCRVSLEFFCIRVCSPELISITGAYVFAKDISSAEMFDTLHCTVPKRHFP